MRIKPGLLLPPPPVPKYVVDAEYVFTYKGELYSYKAHHNYLAIPFRTNNSILLAVFGDDYRYELERIYGYTPGSGSWPVWRAEDITAGQRVFDALISRGVEITIV